jgi:vacuolar-type H+-ATPase subunit H
MENAESPLTRQDLHQVKTEILDAVREVRTEILEKAQELVRDARTEILEKTQELVREARTEILEQTQELVRDAQTEILKAFLPYQETQNVRFQALEINLGNTTANVTARMAILERRLAEIEKRLLLNPPAA